MPPYMKEKYILQYILRGFRWQSSELCLVPVMLDTQAELCLPEKELGPQDRTWP